MCLCDFYQRRIFKHLILPALSQRGIRHVLDMIFFQPFMFSAALAEQMGLNLIDCGNHLVELNQINQAIRVEVRYTDSPDFSILIQLFQFPPRGIVVSERPVEQHQIEITGFQFFQ